MHRFAKKDNTVTRLGDCETNRLWVWYCSTRSQTILLYCFANTYYKIKNRRIKWQIL